MRRTMMEYSSNDGQSGMNSDKKQTKIHVWQAIHHEQWLNYINNAKTEPVTITRDQWLST